MAYAGGEILVQSASNTRARTRPPTVRHGWFEDFSREIRKFERGTAFLTLGIVVDVAKQRFDVPVLFYDGPAHADHSILRFSFHPPGTYESKKPSWQDPEYGTALAIAEAQSKLVLAVDALDVLARSGKQPPDVGMAVDVEKGRFVVRSVKAKGAAAKAGLRAGDVLYSMNGHRLVTPSDYMAGRGVLAETRRLGLVVQRGKRKVDVALVTK
jgi:hypothetical protein